MSGDQQLRRLDFSAGIPVEARQAQITINEGAPVIDAVTGAQVQGFHPYDPRGTGVNLDAWVGGDGYWHFRFYQRDYKVHASYVREEPKP
jgi:hypothetical protein